MDFIVSKLFWVFASPENLFTLLLLIAGFALVSHNEARQRWGRALCFSLALLLFFFSIFPAGQMLLVPLENRFTFAPPEKVDGIILLSGDENPTMTEARAEPNIGVSARRYIKFAELAQKYPDAQLVFSGGTNTVKPAGGTGNADVARRVLTAVGVPLARVKFEDDSRNTYENAQFSAKLVNPKPEENWLLVTSAVHMPRAMGCFRKAGWHVFAAPTDYHSDGSFVPKLSFDLFAHLIGTHLAFHEYYGLIAYWLMGKIETPWPR